MSRRTGPGGRLRPSPRANRPVVRDARHLGHQRPDGIVRTSAESAAPPAHLENGSEPLDAAYEPDAEGRPNAHEGSIDAGRGADPAPTDVAGAGGPDPRRRPGSESRPAAGPTAAPAGEDGGGDRIACTAPQLRRFIKSRVYVPMHELRRRFAINGEDDDVTPVDIASRRIFVGLPAAEGRLLGDLLRNGEVGYELSMDPTTPVVIGVYSMRPVSRS